MDNIRQIGEFIVRMEGRRDSNGNLKVYKLPKSDGGGSYEVAGINDRYHPKEAKILKGLIESKKYKEAEERAIDYILEYTNYYKEIHPDIRVMSFLRDCRFNRGPTGANMILQHSLKVAGTYKLNIDGDIGDRTIEASHKHSAEDLVPRLLLSRQWYERVIVGRDESSEYWSGLTNRWVNAFQVSMSIGNPYVDLK